MLKHITSVLRNITTYEVPHEGNEYYYEGIKSVINGFVWSLLGVIVYSLCKDFSPERYHTLAPWAAMLGFTAYMAVLGFFCNKLKNRIYYFTKDRKPVFNPKLSKFWYLSLQLSTGVFCAFFFDLMFADITVKTLIVTIIFMVINCAGMIGFAQSSIKIAVLLRK
ncbi:hypothetical protein [Ewingella americana]